MHIITTIYDEKYVTESDNYLEAVEMFNDFLNATGNDKLKDSEIKSVEFLRHTLLVKKDMPLFESVIKKLTSK